MPLDLSDKRVRLSLQIGRTIQSFTTIAPMTAEDVIEALCFAAGSACGQKEAHSRSNTKRLRDIATAALDRGIDSAKESTPQVILPN